MHKHRLSVPRDSLRRTTSDLREIPEELASISATRSHQHLDGLAQNNKYLDTSSKNDNQLRLPHRRSFSSLPKHSYQHGLPTILREEPEGDLTAYDIRSVYNSSHVTIAPYRTIAAQFNQLPDGVLYSTLESKKKENVFKNRFPRIVPYDYNRVRVPGFDFHHTGHPKSDYINASYINRDTSKFNYIACQGPLEATNIDFWQMVYSCKVKIIVMLTREDEDGREKCSTYWPQLNDTKAFGDVIVSTERETTYMDGVTRQFNIHARQDSRHTRVYHFQYLSWMDHGTPEPMAFLMFRQRVSIVRDRQLAQGTSRPLLVHCSAGIGRTGTFIAIDYLLESGKETGQIDVFSFVNDLRKSRTMMVANQDQYAFVHIAIRYGVISSDSQYTMEQIQTFLNASLDLNELRLMVERQFSDINRVLSDLEKSERLCASFNMHEGSENNMPSKNQDRLSDVVSLDPYTSRVRGMLIMTHPEKFELADYWATIYDLDTNIIVRCDRDEDYNKVQTYYPRDPDKPTHCDPFSVDTNQIQWYRHFYIQKLTIRLKRDDISGEKEVLHICARYRTKDPDLFQALSNICLYLRNQKHLTEPSKYITAQCTDGSTWSGMFCAIFYVVDMIYTDNIIDVFNSICLIRQRKPSILSSEKQFEILKSGMCALLLKLLPDNNESRNS